MKLLSTNDTELNTISALVFGDTGIGKTSSALTLPPDRTLVVTGERGTLPLAGKGYPVLKFDTWNELKEIYLMLRDPDKIKDPQIKAAVKKTTVVFIDSLSECSAAAVTHILTVERKKLNREASGNMYDDLMQMDDWQLYRSRMLNLISSLTHLPINMIVTCLAAWSKDKQGGDVYRTPQLSGKAALECPAYFDLVFHMESNDEGERVWRTFNDGEILAKDASGILEPFEVSDWTKVFGKILKGKGKSNAETK